MSFPIESETYSVEGIEHSCFNIASKFCIYILVFMATILLPRASLIKNRPLPSSRNLTLMITSNKPMNWCKPTGNYMSCKTIWRRLSGRRYLVYCWIGLGNKKFPWRRHFVPCRKSEVHYCCQVWLTSMQYLLLNGKRYFSIENTTLRHFKCPFN